MNHTDYYAVLGVLPSAEDIVITAAYRALAQRYHPDRWRGDKDEAHRRMSAINEAYGVLHDPAPRAKYDRQRSDFETGDFSQSDDDAMEKAFASALDEVQERWIIAASVFSDIEVIRQRLTRISNQLAFAYVVVLLETKAFDRRAELADQLEQQFLQKYFGADASIIQFARELIVGGHRDAARSLNKLVDVIGSGANPLTLIRKIELDFRLQKHGPSYSKAPSERQKFQLLAREVLKTGYIDLAKDLVRSEGYEVEEFGGGFFSATSVRILRDGHPIQAFASFTEFVAWVKSEICPPIAGTA